jgi:hypothetical protein
MPYLACVTPCVTIEILCLSLIGTVLYLYTRAAVATDCYLLWYLCFANAVVLFRSIYLIFTTVSPATRNSTPPLSCPFLSSFTMFQFPANVPCLTNASAWIPSVFTGPLTSPSQFMVEVLLSMSTPPYVAPTIPPVVVMLLVVLSPCASPGVLCNVVPTTNANAIVAIIASSSFFDI